MATPKRSKAYFGTWNNPQDHCDDLADFDYQTATKEDFLILQKSIINKFVHASNRARKAETSSITVGCELSPSNTFHCHMLFAASRELEFDHLQRIYPTIHLDKPKGSYDACIDYIHKRGTKKNEAKADTMLCEPVAWGDFKFTKEDLKDKKSVFIEIDDLLRKGKRPNQIFAMSPRFAYYAPSVERTFNARESASVLLERPVKTYYHIGKPGTGKSHIFHDLVKAYGFRNVYRIAGEYKNIWDEYAYEKCVIFDDFRGSQIDYSALLDYLQGYNTVLKCRYTNKYAKYDEVHITSIIPPESLYDLGNEEKFSEYDTEERLLDRINHVVYHWTDGEKYYQHQIPMEQYRGYINLEYQVVKEHPDAAKYMGL